MSSASGMLIISRICLGMLRSTGRRVAFRVRLGLAPSPGPFRIIKSMRLLGSIVGGGIGTGC